MCGDVIANVFSCAAVNVQKKIIIMKEQKRTEKEKENEKRKRKRKKTISFDQIGSL